MRYGDICCDCLGSFTMTNELFDRQREIVAGLKLKIPGTDPTVFIVAGDREGISSLFSLDTGADYAGLQKG